MDHNDNTGCPKIIPPHSGYRDLKSYQMAEIIHGGNVVFCDRFIDRQPSYPPRTHDRMVQAARSGKQNIAEGWAGGWAMASGTSKKTELKLVAVARAGGGTACQVAHCLRRRAVGEWDAPPWGGLEELLLVSRITCGGTALRSGAKTILGSGRFERFAIKQIGPI